MIRRCPTCQGALVEDPKIARIERKMELPEKALAEQARTDTQDSTGRLRCPKCRCIMSKEPALESRPAGFRSDTIKDFHVDHCKYCGVTWFDGGELAKLQLSYERSVKGGESKQHYVKYSDLADAQKAEYGHVIAEASRGAGDAICEGFASGLAVIAEGVTRAVRERAR